MLVALDLEMAHYQNQYGAVPHTDEYGNPVRQVDEYGNPVYQSSATTGDYGTAGFDTTSATGMRGHGTAPVAGTHLGTGYHDQRHHGLQRSGSSSSSSSVSHTLSLV